MISRNRWSSIKSLFIAATLFAAPLATTAATALADGPESAVQSYRFDILRNGTPVGTHDIRKKSFPGYTRIEAKSRIRVTFLGFDVYEFDYASEEEWDDDGLRKLRVRVNDDGMESKFAGERVGNFFEWSNGERVESHLLPLYPTNHWNVNVLRQSRVLNTLTGEVDAVVIRKAGKEQLRLPGSTVPASRYRYGGDLDLESWYDDRGTWLAMRFKGEDGSTIEYLCRDCRDDVLM